MSDTTVPTPSRREPPRHESIRFDQLTIDDVARLVLRAVPSTDVMGLFMRHQPPQGIRRRLRAAGCKAEVRRVDERQPNGEWRVIGHSLRCYQPRRRATLILDQLADRGDVVMNYLELALDLVVATDLEARALTRWLTSRLVQPWKRPEPYGEEMTTTYSSQRGWNVAKWTAYPRPCKTTGEPCARVEFRYMSAAKVRTVKLSVAGNPRAMRRPRDVLDLNHLVYWDKRLVLEEVVDHARLGRMIRGRGNAKQPDVERRGRIAYDSDARAAGYAMEVVRIVLGRVPCAAQMVRHMPALARRLQPGHPAYAWAALLERVRPDRVLRAIDPSPLLLPARVDNHGQNTANPPISTHGDNHPLNTADSASPAPAVLRPRENPLKPVKRKRTKKKPTPPITGLFNRVRACSNRQPPTFLHQKPTPPPPGVRLLPPYPSMQESKVEPHPRKHHQRKQRPRSKQPYESMWEYFLRHGTVLGWQRRDDDGHPVGEPVGLPRRE